MIFITLIWGGTFLVVHYAMQTVAPLAFVGLRFFTAGLVLAVFCGSRLAKLTKIELLAGVQIGVAIFLGYTLQTYGLQSIESSRSAFITALYVPLVPILQWVLLRRPPSAMSWLGVLLAFVGLLVLTGAEISLGGISLMTGAGEWLTLLSAIAIALE
ncbi:MAG: DMT family transporter, partial [Pontibacterium sp.]